MGSNSPDRGLNPGPLHWECGLLPTGPPGKSLAPFTLAFSLLSYSLSYQHVYVYKIFFSEPFQCKFKTSCPFSTKSFRVNFLKIRILNLGNLTLL